MPIRENITNVMDWLEHFIYGKDYVCQLLYFLDIRAFACSGTGECTDADTSYKILAPMLAVVELETIISIFILCHGSYVIYDVIPSGS